MSGSRSKPTVGDLVEIPTPQGFAYAQYTHSEKLHGHLLRVLPGLFEQRPSDLAKLAAERERFLTFFPLGAALKQGIVVLAGSAPIPPWAVAFPLLRARGGIEPGTGRVKNWWLWDGKSETRVDELSAEQRKLSLAEVMNDTALIDKIVSGWKPEDTV